MSQTAPAAPELPKRFYKTASFVIAEPGRFNILLDERPVRTPARNVLHVTNARVAEKIVQEWNAQEERINPQTMPLTRLANTVIDGVMANPEPVKQDLANYIETDLLFYRAEGPERLIEKQKSGWDPVVKWASDRVGNEFRSTAGVMHISQSDEALAGFWQIADRLDDPFVIAALHQLVTITGSAILGFAVLEGRLSAEAAFELSQIDEDWNIELWGEDEEAADRRRRRHADAAAAGIVLTAEE
ncbi:ATPase [Aureimonas fodinaquatilis]|uniref:ATPase n=1 Tax=Aureimonas fodinaquatilis TaxID=2565783 RepID=A0A5B0DVT2_9HYPH|nr:ATP12 family protein [Aureimonas fodinaquatilis]KAA0970854.1 ATPase [Aureimonas fodinaquatilis]